MSLAAEDPTTRLKVGVDVRCLVEPELRGFSRYTDELLHGFGQLDSVELVGLSDRPLPRELGFDVHVVEEGREWAVEQVGFPSAARRLEFDVLFCPTNRGLPAMGVPSVLTLHDAVEWDRRLVERPSGKSMVRFGYASTASLAGATRIITVSEHARGELERRLGLDPARIDVVTEAPGRRFLRPVPPSQLREIRDRYGLPPRYVLYVGGFDPKKSVDTLVRSWALVPAADRPALLLAGSRTADADATLRLADELGVEVRLLGYIDDEDLPGLYRGAELFVFPAIAEGFGLPPLEAMACGTPSIVADAGALPEVVGAAALRFPARDHVALASLLRSLLADPGERTRLSNVARTHALAHDWVAVARETEAVLRRAAATSLGSRWLSGISSLRSVGKWMR